MSSSSFYELEVKAPNKVQGFDLKLNRPFLKVATYRCIRSQNPLRSYEDEVYELIDLTPTIFVRRELLENEIDLQFWKVSKIEASD